MGTIGGKSKPQNLEYDYEYDYEYDIYKPVE